MFLLIYTVFQLFNIGRFTLNTNLIIYVVYNMVNETTTVFFFGNGAAISEMNTETLTEELLIHSLKEFRDYRIKTVNIKIT
jgi:hypothetical protein